MKLPQWIRDTIYFIEQKQSTVGEKKRHDAHSNNCDGFAMRKNFHHAEISE